MLFDCHIVLSLSRTVSSLRTLFFHQLAEARSSPGSNQSGDVITASTSGASSSSSKHSEPPSLPAILEPSSLSSDSVVIVIPQG
ncbi:hypothetical protein LSTR_LSTR016076 [Laodelphax striatellus]|uniref:Uncharacterized protein n=1 Tax=Laodelphax striatellus TaxID=195883 RepID=A0A482X1T2_LAOST|nr:hypothetical protein LSTR_LSTR016076 [Laodelphax striatellus]